MRSVLPLLLCLIATPDLGAQSFPPGTTPTSLAIGFGSAVAVSRDEVLVGRPGMVLGFPMPASQTGAVHVYRRGSGGRWTEVSTVTAGGLSIEDGFGSSIAVEGNLMAVGAPGTSERRGAVYVFERDASGRWAERARLTAGAAEADDQLGRSIAIRGGVLLAGAPGHAKNQGRVVVFRRSSGAGAGSWTEQGVLVGSSANATERFGAAVALDGNRAVIGAPGQVFGDSAGPGRVVVFRQSRDAWLKEATLAARNEDRVRGLGAALLVQGGELYAAAPATDSMAGAVYRFRSTGSGRWEQTARLTASSREHPAFFGGALAADGSELLVGAPFADHGVGVVHVFRRDGSNWKEQQKLTTPGVGPATLLGAALAVSKGVAVVGAPQAEFFEGSALIYQKDRGGQWRPSGSVADSNAAGLAAVTGGEAKCEGGKARAFECRDADLVSFLPVSALGGKRGVLLNDIWGWTDSVTNREFALVGRTNGTAFVEVTDPANPKYLGELPMHKGARSNIWRDIKVYKNHAFIV
ncbi:MAG TPA: choice-of-anchor B family protein, partial [Gemmatimonadales bacterium]|nr:choice-of-anchor B family protein [Gemmatimonadales bacterium]